MDHKNFLFLAFILLINSTGYNALEGESILGGEDAQDDEYLYTVSLQTDNDNYCSGAVIGPYHVVTAAHCVATVHHEFFGKPIAVVGGTTDLNDFSSKRQAVFAEKAYIHSRFGLNSNGTGDIAVLKLSEPINFGPNSCLKLPSRNEDYAGSVGIVTGFGWNKVTEGYNENGEVQEKGKSFQKMRFAHVQIFKQSKCSALEGSKVPWAVLCARMIQRNPNIIQGVCGGDSGGPLVVKGQLIGVVNNSPRGCNERVLPSMYARISSYLNFIESAVNDEPDPSFISNVLPPPTRI